MSLHEFAKAEMHRCYVRLCEVGQHAPSPLHVTIRCDLKGRSRVGVAYPHKSLIRLSPSYYEALGPRYAQTVAHEYAHLVVRYQEEKFGLMPSRAHGQRWQRIMRCLGYAPERTLGADRAALCEAVKPARVARKYVYEGVNCGHEFLFSGLRHRRAERGRTIYFCAKPQCAHRPRDERGLAFTGEVRV